MTTWQIFKAHNDMLLLRLIDNEPPEATFAVDPNDPIFDKPLNNL